MISYPTPAWKPGIPRTKSLYNQVIAFYFELYQAHPSLLDLDQKEVLTQAEKLTHRTDRNSIWPLNEIIEADFPALMRRAAINAARGAFKSFHFNYGRWQKQKEKFEAKGKRFHQHPPIPPRVFNFNLPFYAGMFKERIDTEVMVRLYSGTSWQWVKLRLAYEPSPKMTIGRRIAISGVATLTLIYMARFSLPNPFWRTEF